MAKLIYTAITSLDGFIEDESGGFEWSIPDPEIHSFINELERDVGTYLYGRRMYETMAVWQTLDADDVEPRPDYWREALEYGELWRAADKVVYSRTLPEVTTPRTRLEREFDPAAVERMKDEAGRDVSVSGPTLAEHAFAAGLVDEVRLVVFPVVVGGGKATIPRGISLDLDLVAERRFENGAVYLGYRVRRPN